MSGEVATVVQEGVHVAHERVTENEVCCRSAHELGVRPWSLTNSGVVRSRREDTNAEVAAVFIDLDIRDVDGVHRIHA